MKVIRFFFTMSGTFPHPRSLLSPTAFFCAVIGGLSVLSPVSIGARERAMPAVPGPVAAQIIRVVDGDTLTVRALIWIGQEVETNVRLTGIDTPELRGKCPEEKALAERAKFHLMLLTADGAVSLHDIVPDKFGRRVLARVENAQGVDLAADLIRNGFARPYHGAARKGWCDGD